MDALTFAITVLAVWRVSLLITADEGPFSVLETLRSKIDPNQATWLGRGVRCVGCVSFWVSLAAALLLRASALEWLGMAGGALLVHRIAMRQT